MLSTTCRRRLRLTSSSSSCEQRSTVGTQNTSSIVQLNVGGRQYVTTQSTIQHIPECMLAVMLSGPIPSAMINGSYFIDRDPDLFAYVLEYLRTGTVELPSSETILRRLQREADFFMLPGLQHQIRSKLLEVCLEVKLYQEPFNCSTMQCYCGLDADVDELRHPKNEHRPNFTAPCATVHVDLKTYVPRSPDEARIVIELGHCTRMTSLADLASLGAEQIGLCGCKGVYEADGVFNDRTKYKSAGGAVVYYTDGQWRVNNEDNTNSFMFHIVSNSMWPPSGRWASDRSGWCLVQGFDYLRPDETSMEEAVWGIDRALINVGLAGCAKESQEISKQLRCILTEFVEDPETTLRVMYKKLGPYDVEDVFWKKDRRRHYQSCLKVEFNVHSATQCKRRRLDDSNLSLLEP